MPHSKKRKLNDSSILPVSVLHEQIEIEQKQLLIKFDNNTIQRHDLENFFSTINSTVIGYKNEINRLKSSNTTIPNTNINGNHMSISPQPIEIEKYKNETMLIQ